MSPLRVLGKRMAPEARPGFSATRIIATTRVCEPLPTSSRAQCFPWAAPRPHPQRPGPLTPVSANPHRTPHLQGSGENKDTMSSPPITCDVHLDGPALNRCSIEGLDGGFSLRLNRHFYKTEPSSLTGDLVGN